jgi:Mrp family chromosome partitioning ATPase
VSFTPQYVYDSTSKANVTFIQHCTGGQLTQSFREQVHIPFPSRSNPSVRKIEKKELAAINKPSKKNNPRNPNYVAPVETVVEKKRARPQNPYRGNPDAKFVYLAELEARHLLNAERHIGEVFAFPEPVVRKLDTLGMLNKRQGFQFMRAPASVMRPNAGLVTRELMAQDVIHLGTRERRVVVAGKGGSGKSFILLQTAAMALMQNYVIVAVPRGSSLRIVVNFRNGFSG